MNKPVAWMLKTGHGTKILEKKPYCEVDYWIPLYTHPVKEHLSNGHLSDCAIHNEPAFRNKPCDCGFEPRFNLSDLKHEDNCRYFDDGEFCTCGAENSELVEWYRHKEATHPVDAVNISQEYVDKTQNNRHELTDEEITAIWQTDECYQNAQEFAKAILRKAHEK